MDAPIRLCSDDGQSGAYSSSVGLVPTNALLVRESGTGSRFSPRNGGCGIGSCGVPRPSPSGRLCHADGPLPEAMVLKETRSNSQIPTPFPHRFALNSHALTSVEGLLGQDGIDATIQTTSTSKAGRVDFGGCGPPATMNDEGLVDAAAARPLPRFKGPYGDQANRQVTTRIGFPLQRSLIRITPWGALAPPVRPPGPEGSGRGPSARGIPNRCTPDRSR